MNEDRKKLQRARHLLRLCIAAQVTFAKLGKDAVVADILKTAGMSRRSFYEYFTSLEHAWECMNAAWLVFVSEGPDWSPPHAWWMAYVANPGVLVSAGEGADEDASPNVAFEEARRVKAMHEANTLDDAGAPSNVDVLEWLRLMVKAGVRV